MGVAEVATAREIITVWDPKAAILRKRAAPVGKVTREVQRLIGAMLETVRVANGLGLAAPQIGEGVRVIVAQVEDRTVTLADPEIIRSSGEETAAEACLSIPGMYGDVPRAATISVRGKNRRGRRVAFEATGLLARVLQHEIDHLDGVLFLDRVRDPSTIGCVTAVGEAAPAAE